MPFELKRAIRSASREEDQLSLQRSISIEEQEIKPIITRPRNFESRFKHILNERQQYLGADDGVAGDDHIIEDDRIDSDTKYMHVKQKLERKYRSIDKGEKNNYFDEDERKINDDYRYAEKEIPRRSSETSRNNDKSIDYSANDHKNSFDYRENLTDKQKFRDSLIEKQKFIQTHHHREHFSNNDSGVEFYERKPVSSSSRQHNEQSFEKKKSSPSRKMKYDSSPAEKSIAYSQEQTMERSGYRNRSHDHDKHHGRNFTDRTMTSADYDNSVARNPYKEPDSLPYRESIEKMIKSPVMRYKSFDSNQLCDDVADGRHGGHAMDYNSHEIKRVDSHHRYRDSNKYIENNLKYEPSTGHISRRRLVEKNRSSSRSPETISKVSPKDRFQDAKEKFQAMERDRVYLHDKSQVRLPIDTQPPRRGSFERGSHNIISQHGGSTSHDRKLSDWSSDEEQKTPPPTTTHQRKSHVSSSYRNDGRTQNERYIDMDESSRVLGPAKSLGNLVKGYRHSYAEPRNPLPRNSGRVGLAAVNPF